MGLDLGALLSGITQGMGSAQDFKLAEQMRRASEQRALSQRQTLASEDFAREKELRQMIARLQESGAESRFTRNATQRDKESATAREQELADIEVQLKESEKDRQSAKEIARMRSQSTGKPSFRGSVSVDGHEQQVIVDPATGTARLEPLLDNQGNQVKSGRQPGELTDAQIDMKARETANTTYRGLMVNMLLGGSDPLSPEGQMKMGGLDPSILDPDNREAVFSTYPKLGQYYQMVLSWAKSLHAGDLSIQDFNERVQGSRSLVTDIGAAEIEQDNPNSFLDMLREKVNKLSGESGASGGF